MSEPLAVANGLTLATSNFELNRLLPETVLTCLKIKVEQVISPLLLKRL